MSTRRNSGRRILGLATALALAACSPPAPRDYSGHGEARDIDPIARTITLEHEEIPGLMKGMTMTFAVAPEVDLAAVVVGSEVDFGLRDEDGTLTVTRVESSTP